MTTISPEELPTRAFQLAYFLHRERETATEIAARALNKLQLAATAQGKRLYYRLTGRADARKARSKVSLGEPQLLQRLVYVESEEYERRKEAAAQDDHAQAGASAGDMVVFFIKHLVRITTKRNSFYVTLGLSRLLYNYTTAETMELYNLVIQDPDRVHDDYYYRSRKGLLLKELKERFGELVEVTKGARGEQRWRAAEDNSRHAALVRDCLLWFTPWASPCVVPERFDPLSDTIKQLDFQGRFPDEEHEVEVNRIHAALHPVCFARLVAANRMATPDARLDLPHFFLAHHDDDSDDSSRTPPNLSADELATINNLLAQEATRRRAVSAGFLRVLVDGMQRAEIDIEDSAVTRFVVNEQAEVIEVYSSDQRGALLLAAHLLNFNGADKQTFTITAEGGQRIEFIVDLLRDEDGATTGAQLAVTFKETSPRRAASLTARRMLTRIVPAPAFSGWWKPASAFAVLALLLAGAWWVWTNRPSRNEIVGMTPTPAPTVPVSSPVPTPTGPKPIEQQPQTAPPANRAPQGRNEVAPPIMAQQRPGAGERNEAFVERSLLPGSGNDEPGETATRGAWKRELMGKPLNEVHQLHIQDVAGNALSQDLANDLRAGLNGNGTLRLSNVEGADAALKISARPASPRSDDSRVIVLVRAVNANGYVVWPAARRGSSWRYVGLSRNVADRIIADLARDIAGAKR